MARIQWEYDLVERPFCQQLQAMGWEWLEGDGDVPELTERASFPKVLLKGTEVDGLPDWDHGRNQPVKYIDFVQPEFVSGECFTYLGRSCRLLVVARRDRSLPDWRERQKELQVRAAAIYWCGAPMGH